MSADSDLDRLDITSRHRLDIPRHTSTYSTYSTARALMRGDERSKEPLRGGRQGHSYGSCNEPRGNSYGSRDHGSSYVHDPRGSYDRGGHELCAMLASSNILKSALLIKCP